MTEFDALYRQHVEAVFRYAMRTVGRADLAEDLVAEAFLELHKRLSTIRPQELPAWLFVVVRNRAVDHWRRQQRERQHLATLEAEPSVEPKTFDPWWLRIEGLKAVHRVCLHLRYVYDLDRADIARATGLSETQVKGHLQYARQLLRQQFQKSQT